jgi:hypothetical protein
MPLGKLVYMPEESTPTIATEGNRQAVAYLEPGEHADHYGRMFAASLDGYAAAIEVIQDWQDTSEVSPEAIAKLQDFVRRASQDALAAPSANTITVTVEGGLVQDVTGIPAGYELLVEDHDGGDTSHPSWDAEKECFVTIYEGGAV